jgi:hypothetical protein
MRSSRSTVPLTPAGEDHLLGFVALGDERAPSFDRLDDIAHSPGSPPASGAM